MLNCKEFVNADEIAKGLSPFQPDAVAFEAGRIMLNRIRELIRSKVILLLRQLFPQKVISHCLFRQSRRI
jgi:predicted ABC-type ATPase